ncbi:MULTISPECIES: type IX secretion system outer membrane channel protein PorV [Myroides]|uniref:Type IX secretion system outer membrane channel protein PorV n=1 Tax=Myroides albus TaxID=2562892 RepID=A0A6I3LQR4_9FLAO|nr:MULTISPECIES: type IX secretion system outer membrane channel protein PorV [Myroides]MTG99021.1 type IX secretion system outer membrane channel protein PorV [Myroides albus]MVX35941.1 type IX secretion system outer membrane channel protein PorV [Myroides sp. LoEW2-1]
MKKISFILLAGLVSQYMLAQDIRPIVVGVPFLTINSDARSAGMGDMGVGTSVDAYSQQHNPAKYAFAEQSQAFSMSYTPYMSKIASGMSLGQLTYYNKYNERSAVGASLRYFGMGDIEMRQQMDDMPVNRKPNEFAIDVSYSLKLSDNFSMAVAGRFINSNLKYPDEVGGNSNASTFAVDVSGFYESRVMQFANFDGRWRAGFNIQNLGPKIEYDDLPNGSFIPATLKLGGGFDFIIDSYNTLTLTGEVSKLLVPTPPRNAFDEEAKRDYNDIGWFKGVFKSFGDAPDGFSEEMKEVMWSMGAEYWYDNRFAFRTGYFHESKDKGARQFATVGAGFKYNMVTVDLSYLFSTSSVNNPLENTLRFSLTFDLGRKTYPKG